MTQKHGLRLVTLLILTDGAEQGGAGGLDHHVRVEEDRLEQRLGEGGQLGDKGCQSEVDAETIVRKIAYPDHCKRVNIEHMLCL